MPTPTLQASLGYIEVSSVEEAHLELPPPPEVGQVVLQMSADRHNVAKVPVVEKILVVVAWVPVAFVNVNLFKVDEAPAVKLVP